MHRKAVLILVSDKTKASTIITFQNKTGNVSVTDLLKIYGIGYVFFKNATEINRSNVEIKKKTMFSEKIALNYD